MHPTISPQSGDGTNDEVRSLHTKMEHEQTRPEVFTFTISKISNPVGEIGNQSKNKKQPVSKK